MQRIARLLDRAMKVGGAVSAKVRVVVPERRQLELVAQRGLSPRFVADFRTIAPTAPAPSAVAIATGRRVYVSDVADDPRAALYREAGAAEGFSAMQSTPIVLADGRALGALSTHFARKHPISSADTVILTHCADAMARVLEELGPPVSPRS